MTGPISQPRVRKIVIVIGTRPEAIKMAPLIRRLQKCSNISTVVCSTGQHREMIKQVFELFSLSPDVDLELMRFDQRLSDLTARVLIGMEAMIAEQCPDRLIVHGDTTTTMAAALAAYYQKIPVAHVEAGLRTGDIYAPWPEEMNRRIVDVIADRLFAPTLGARANLVSEGVPSKNIKVTGNTGIDALLDTLKGPLADMNVRRKLEAKFSFFSNDKRTILVTCHRRESFGDGFRNISAALIELAQRSDVQILFPMHRNPNVRATFAALGSYSNVILVEPLDYLDFVFAQSKSHFVVTDSGGVQEEAPSLGKPVLVLRDLTERPEAVAAGTAKLVGTDTAKIVLEASRLLDDSEAYASMSTIHNPFGDGTASDQIITFLTRDFEDE